MMVKCHRCGLSYSHVKSTSSLVLTYCSVLCEVFDLGYSLAAFEKAPLLKPIRVLIPSGSNPYPGGPFQAAA